MEQLAENTFWISGNTPSSKNNRRWTGKYFIVSKATAKWRKDTEEEWISQRDRFIALTSRLDKPYYIELTFIRKSRHSFDYVNISQGVFDEMVRHGWIMDDNADEMKPYFGDYKYNKKKPGVYIKVLTKKPEHDSIISDI